MGIFDKQKPPTPVEAAADAMAKGLPLVQVPVPVTPDSSEMLAAIEGQGWRIAQVGFVFVQQGTANPSFGGWTLDKAKGQIVGIYVFRRP